MLFGKNLICLSFLLSISLISNQLSASAPAIVIGTGTIIAIVHVPAVVAIGTVGAGVVGLMGVSYGAYRGGKYLWRRFISPSQQDLRNF